MKCRDCKWFYTNETMGSLYICVNGNCDNFGQYTGICCEDDCEDGEGYDATDREVFGTDDVFSLSASEAVSKLEAWEKKQEQNEKSCKTCKSNPPEKKWPCVDCDVSIHDRYEPKQEQTEKNCKECEIYSKALRGKFTVKQIEESCDTCEHGEAYKQGSDITTMDDECGGCCSWNSKWTPKDDTPEMNVESIKVWDEVKDNFGNKLLVTHVYSECRNVDTIDTDGRFERFPSEFLKKTGRRYCFQELLDAMKSEKPEEGGE